MTTSLDTFCDTCTAQDRTVHAIKWCPECEEALCTGCLQHHGVSKSSRNHITIDLSDHKKLPDFVSNIRLSCEEHREKFLLFCPDHDVACCGICVADNHTNCKGLVAISDILDNAKSSSALQDVEEILVDLRKNIEIIVKNRKQNLDNVQNKFQFVRDVLKETREKILKHLDELERKLIIEIENKESEIKQETEKLITKMTKKDLKIKENQEHVKAIKEYGTNIQTFFGSREIIKFGQSEERYIGTFFEHGTLNNNCIQFVLGNDIERCVSAETFGKLLLTTLEAEIEPVSTKNRAAQIGKEVTRTKSIDDIKVTLKNKFRVSSGKSEISITGCDVTPDGKLVFADHSRNRSIVLHAIDGTYINHVLVLEMSAFDVSAIDERTVIGSASGNKRIYTIDILNKTVLTTFETSNYCCGITHVKNEKVVSAVYNQGIVSYDMKDNLSTTIRTETLGNFSYVTCFLNRIYYTNTSDHSVTCLNQNGEFIWTFVDESLIKDPRSIATDQHGNVFVSSRGNDSIVVISADGKHGRKILDKKDGINNAWAMCCDKIRKRLVITNWSGDVLVFDIV